MSGGTCMGKRQEREGGGKNIRGGIWGGEREMINMGGVQKTGFILSRCLIMVL